MTLYCRSSWMTREEAVGMLPTLVAYITTVVPCRQHVMQDWLVKPIATTSYVGEDVRQLSNHSHDRHHYSIVARCARTDTRNGHC